MTPKEFFENKFAKKVSEDPACMKNAGVVEKMISLDISGPTGGQWTFVFDAQGHLSMQNNALNPSAECQVSMKDELFKGMLEGKVNVPMAFVMRKIKVKGETPLAAKLGIALQKNFK
jgi:putative sterol carrier protein